MQEFMESIQPPDDAQYSAAYLALPAINRT